MYGDHLGENCKIRPGKYCASSSVNLNILNFYILQNKRSVLNVFPTVGPPVSVCGIKMFCDVEQNRQRETVAESTETDIYTVEFGGFK